MIVDVRVENLFIAAAVKDNVNAALIFEFLHKFLGIGKAYFGKFDEESVKNNFVLVYELLDGFSFFIKWLKLLEILDFGYPQNNDVDTLKMYITTEGIRTEKSLVILLSVNIYSKAEDSAKITIQTTGATSWRRQDIKYRKNEAYLDVIESVNVLMSAKGNFEVPA